jgi:NADH-quinone oxidoreductase subunit H
VTPSPGPFLSLAVVAAALLAGAWLVAVLDELAAAAVAGRAPRDPLLGPLRRAARLVLQQRVLTERPDRPAWLLAPAAYAGLAAAGLAVVPWSERLAPADVPAGIVVWGSVEALAVVAVFLHGWSGNAHLGLAGGYRFVSLGLPIMLISMFVLIGAALPAESLRLGAVVVSQRELWNVVRQPLGLPLFLLVGWAVTFWGPFDFADSADLAGGTSADLSGPSRLVWEVARRALLVSFSAVAATVFLGGWSGPWLPGPLWLAVKTVAVLAVLVLPGRRFARVDTSRMLTLVWVVLLPLSFLALLAAGLEALP